VFARFAQPGSARQVWLWLCLQGLRPPLQSSTLEEIRHVLTNPVYAGACVYGKTRQPHCVDVRGRVRMRVRRLPRSERVVSIRNHHPGFIDWETLAAKQARIGTNTRPGPHEPGGAVREGAALLQGITTCGRCGRGLRVYCGGRNSTPGDHCAGGVIVNGRGEYCPRVGGRQIDDAVASAFLATLARAGLDASLRAIEQLEGDHDAALVQRRLQVERACYEAQRAAACSPIRTVEEPVALVRRVVSHYPDAVIAGILNRQGRRTATDLRFTSNRVSSLRNHWSIACFVPAVEPTAGKPVNVRKAAEILGVAPSTVHRWINDDFIAG
jgi:hypothetical protein